MFYKQESWATSFSAFLPGQEPLCILTRWRLLYLLRRVDSSRVERESRDNRQRKGHCGLRQLFRQENGNFPRLSSESGKNHLSWSHYPAFRLRDLQPLFQTDVQHHEAFYTGCGRVFHWRSILRYYWIAHRPLLIASWKRVNSPCLFHPIFEVVMVNVYKTKRVEPFLILP